MSGLMRLRNRTALITGAGGGIGAATAHVLAARGCNLILTDISEPDLEATRTAITQALGSRAPRISQYRLDVGDPDAIAALPATVSRDHARLDIVMNNAGVALGGTFEQISDQDFDWLFGINFWGVVRMTRAFLPMLRNSDEARLINVSSLFGLIVQPGQTAYCAAKFAVRGFSTALALELADSHVGVTVVHPGGVRTAIATSARLPAGATETEVRQARDRFSRLLRLSPEKAAEIIVAAVERRRSRVIVGSDALVASLIERLMPVGYPKLLARMAS